MSQADQEAITQLLDENKALRHQRDELLKACKGAETALCVLVLLIPDGAIKDQAVSVHSQARAAIALVPE